jgi:hypothetical protein
MGSDTKKLTDISSFKGWFATEAALNAAYPTGQDSWHAIVGATDTVWVWDSGTSAWVDSGLGSLVTSVFTRTGAITAQNNDYTWAQINKTTSDIADITTKSHTSLTDKGTKTHATIDSELGDNNQIIYIGKHGNDGSDGETIGKAKLTIGSALTAASALTPAVGNQICLRIIDSGTYSESYTSVDYVHLIGLGAKVIGNIVVNSDVKIYLGELNGNLTVNAAKELRGEISTVTGSITKTGKIRGRMGTDLYIKDIIFEV